jgi:hypothetical protein
MSASGSVVCMKCQAIGEPGNKFCAQCGEVLPAALLQATTATRSYVSAASEAEKDSRKGQQKWGLFETNYQRNKGISTAESMQEIEDFARTGIRPEAHPGTVPWTAKHGGGSSHGGESSSHSSHASSSESVTPGSSSAGSASGAAGSTGGGATFFPKGDDEGTKLFAKYQAGQKKINPTPYQGKKWSTPGTK